VFDRVRCAKEDAAMAPSPQARRRRGTRRFVVALALLGSLGLVVGPGGPVGALTQAADVGPLTVVTPTRILDTRASEPPAIQTVGFDAASGTPITAGPIQGGTTQRYRIAGKPFPQGTGSFTFPEGIVGVLVNVTEVGAPG